MPEKKTKTTKKMKNGWKLTTIPLHSWLTFWVLVLATMALATVCFTNAFKTADGEIDTESVEAFKAIQKNLEQQVADLQSQVGVSNEIRYSYDDFIRYELDNECLSSEGGSVDTSKTPLTYVTYVDPKTSVRMTLPYSFGWGTVNCPPVQTANETILFGPSRRGEGGAGRESSLSIEAPSSTAAIRATIEADLAQSTQENKAIRQRTVNGLTVLSYHHSFELGSINAWVAIGRTYVYRIHSAEWLTDAEAIKIIQSLRVEN